MNTSAQSGWTTYCWRGSMLGKKVEIETQRAQAEAQKTQAEAQKEAERLRLEA